MLIICNRTINGMQLSCKVESEGQDYKKKKQNKKKQAKKGVKVSVLKYQLKFQLNST